MYRPPGKVPSRCFQDSWIQVRTGEDRVGLPAGVCRVLSVQGYIHPGIYNNAMNCFMNFPLFIEESLWTLWPADRWFHACQAVLPWEYGVWPTVRQPQPSLGGSVGWQVGRSLVLDLIFTPILWSDLVCLHLLNSLLLIMKFRDLLLQDFYFWDLGWSQEVTGKYGSCYGPSSLFPPLLLLWFEVSQG